MVIYTQETSGKNHGEKRGGKKWGEEEEEDEGRTAAYNEASGPGGRRCSHRGYTHGVTAHGADSGQLLPGQTGR